MKSLKDITEAGEVAVPGAGMGHAYPKGSRHKDFTDKHAVATIDHPVADDNQFTGKNTRKKKRLADYEYDKTQNKKTPDVDQDNPDNQDAAAYEEVIIDDNTTEEDFLEITDEISDRIATVYESLSEENRNAFDILLETDEGFEKILEFVSDFEFVEEDEEDEE